MLDCDCPRCGSANTKALSVLYENGVRQSEYRKDGLFYFRRSIGLHTSRTRGSSQTLASANASPAVSTSTRMLTAGGVPIVLNLGLLVGGATGFWVAFGALIAFAIVGGRFDSKARENNLRLWSSSFRCNRCGTVFAVIEDEPRVEALEGARASAAGSVTRRIREGA